MADGHRGRRIPLIRSFTLSSRLPSIVCCTSSSNAWRCLAYRIERGFLGASSVPIKDSRIRRTGFSRLLNVKQERTIAAMLYRVTGVSWRRQADKALFAPPTVVPPRLPLVEF